MDEEIKAQIIPIIENTKEGLAKAVDFLCEQSPLLVKEILWWHGIRSAIWFIIFLAVAFAGICYLKKIGRGFLIDESFCKERCGSRGDCCLCPVGAAIYSVIFCVVFPVLALNTLTWLKILIAPRLFLLEFLKDAIT